MSGFDLCQNPDGANFQAQAVLALLRYNIGDGIEASWDDAHKRYMAEPRVVRYDNCREQGYVVYLRSRDYQHQINVAFYEHRNSDSICAVVSAERTLNAPRLGDMTKAMGDKWDVAHSVGVGRVAEMAEWVARQLLDFWAKYSAIYPLSAQ